MLRFMKQRAALAVLAVVVCGGALAAAVGTVRAFRLDGHVKPGKQSDGTTLVVTQQLLKPWTPEIYIPGRPVDMSFNSDKSLLAVMNTREINLIDEKTGKVEDIRTGITSYAGIAFRPGDKEIWVSEASRKGGTASIMIHTFGKAAPERIRLKKFALPAGIAFSRDGTKAYVALNGNNTIGIFDAATRKLEKEIGVGLAPLFVKVSPDGKTLYASNRGGRVPSDPKHIGLSAGVAMAVDDFGAVLDGTISVVDLQSGTDKQITVGRAPSGLALSEDGSLLAVTNSHSDSVTVMDTSNGKLQTVAIPTMPDKLIGTLPTAAVFSPDAQRLYVTAGLNNSVVVLERKGSGDFHVGGAVPTGWFPSAIAIDGHGQLAVLNIKGRGNTKAETLTVAPKSGPIDEAYNTHSFEGSLMRLPVLNNDQLKQATDFVVAANNPTFTSDGGIADLSKLGIKHVILIVKENRTYDQVLGDMGKGNGEPKFTMFGKDVTPNEHALAAKYVLLDNFYATGAISFDGHQWLEQGFVSDNMERSTSGPRGYAYNLNDALDVSPAGVFWEHQTRPLDVKIGGVLSTGVKLTSKDRDDDDRVQGDIDEVKASDWAENYKRWQAGKWHGIYGSKAAVPMLARYEDTNWPAGGAVMPDQVRASYVEEYIADAEKKDHLPDLLVWSLGGDHTMGTRPGAPSPLSMVADNDLAVGRIVETVSKSKFWSDTVIFIVEDDAQNGTDHVDGHRTVALVVGPMIKRDAIDSNFYTQVSMARTIQDILGLTPSTHFLKAARPMSTIFTTQKDLSPFTHLPNKTSLTMMNPSASALNGQAKKDALLSARMNWNDFDDVPEQTLNRILWANVKGYETPMPAPRHTIPNNVH